MEKKTAWIAAILVIGIIITIGAIFIIQKNKSIVSVVNFEECREAGYPVMESSPQQCRTPDGRTFVREEGKEVSFLEIKKGLLGNGIFIEEQGMKQQRIITSTEQWSDLWTEMFPTEQIASAIDFDDSILLAVFMGRKGSGGNGITIEKIIENSQSIDVFSREISPGKNCVTASVINNPYHIVQIKKSEKKVNFIFEQGIRDC